MTLLIKQEVEHRWIISIKLTISEALTHIYLYTDYKYIYPPNVTPSPKSSKPLIQYTAVPWLCPMASSYQGRQTVHGPELNEGQGCFRSSWWLGKVLRHLLWESPNSSRPPSSEACRLVILPEGYLPIITTRGQEPWLLRIPSHTVDILGMGLTKMGCQREGGLLWVWAWIFLKHSDGIISTGCSQGPCQLTPERRVYMSG